MIRRLYGTSLHRLVMVVYGTFSTILASVNEMAGPMMGGAIICAAILLLFFGHGLNMILNVLSVIVHGVRLNTLEFSNHLGMSWAGFSYKPFSEKE